MQTLDLSGDKVPAEVLTATEQNHSLEVSGEYGDRNAGEPIQYEHLVIQHSGGRKEITFYNRRISLLFGDNETERHIHRLCVILERLPKRKGR